MFSPTSVFVTRLKVTVMCELNMINWSAASFFLLMFLFLPTNFLCFLVQKLIPTLIDASATKSHFPHGIIQLFHVNILFTTLASVPFSSSSRQSHRCNPMKESTLIIISSDKYTQNHANFDHDWNTSPPKAEVTFHPPYHHCFPSFFVAAHASVTQSAV